MLLIHSARGVRLNPGCCGMSSVRFCASAEFHLSQPGQPSSSWRISRGLPLPPLTTTRSASSTRTVSSCHSAVPLPDAIAHFLSPRIEYHERVSLEKRILDANRLASGQADRVSTFGRSVPGRLPLTPGETGAFFGAEPSASTDSNSADHQIGRYFAISAGSSSTKLSNWTRSHREPKQERRDAVSTKQMDEVLQAIYAALTDS